MLNVVEKVWIVATLDMFGGKSERAVRTSAVGTAAEALYAASLDADPDLAQPIEANFSHYTAEGGR